MTTYLVKIKEYFSPIFLMENITIDSEDKVAVNTILLHKLAFVYNALEDGWTIKKKNNLYVFTKNHEGKKEVYLDEYLKRFMTSKFDINSLLSCE